MAIEVDKVYTYEECEKLSGKSHYYFKQCVRERRLRADAIHPNSLFEKAIYGRDLIRFLQNLQWGRALLYRLQTNTIDEDLFIDRDIEELEKTLKHLNEVKEERTKALITTLTKIAEVERQIKELDKRKEGK